MPCPTPTAITERRTSAFLVATMPWPQRPCRGRTSELSSRRDRRHLITTRVVRENSAILIEDLAAGDMVADHVVARATWDAV